MFSILQINIMMNKTNTATFVIINYKSCGIKMFERNYNPQYSNAF